MNVRYLMSSIFASSWKGRTSPVLDVPKEPYLVSKKKWKTRVPLSRTRNLAGSPFKNHSTQQQTESSLNNHKSISNIQKQHGPADDRFIKANFNKVQIDTKCSESISSVVQEPTRGDDCIDYCKNILRPPGRGGQISNNLQSISPKHVQMLATNYRSKDYDVFAELDSPSIDSETEKMSIANDRILSSNKEQQPSSVSGARMTGESLQEVRDFGPHMKRIQTRETYDNKRNFIKHRRRRSDYSQHPPLNFVVKDDPRNEKENNEEIARKQKSINQVKESNTIRGGEKSVCIEYVPQGISLLEIRNALSIYGEIVGSYLRPSDGGMPGCQIEFKTVEDKERALSDRWVFVNGKQLSVCRVDFPVTTVVRITNLGPETTINNVHSICMSYGKMERLQMSDNGALDAYFSISEMCNMPKILEKLNEVTLNNSRWMAQPAPRLSQCLAETPQGQNWLGKQLSNQLGNIRKQLQLKRIYLEDIEKLHSAIMHIKECPNPFNNEST